MTDIVEMKIFICEEVFPGCDHKCTGESDTDVLIRTARHLRADHDVQEISPGLLERIRAAIHSGRSAAS